jgi:hypothetical protein
VLGESRLNVYILGDRLSARQRERVQAQVQTALRAVPQWAFALLDRRLDELGVRNFPLIIEPVPADHSENRSLSFGDIESRPAVKLMPRMTAGNISWGQDRRYLVLKAVAYLASPAASDTSFWGRWEQAVHADNLRSQVIESGELWKNASSLDLLVEMFAAYALNPGHARWADLPAVRTFLEEWR